MTPDTLRALIGQWRERASVLEIERDVSGGKFGEIAGKCGVYRTCAEDLEEALLASPGAQGEDITLLWQPRAERALGECARLRAENNALAYDKTCLHEDMEAAQQRIRELEQERDKLREERQQYPLLNLVAKRAEAAEQRVTALEARVRELEDLYEANHG